MTSSNSTRILSRLLVIVVAVVVMAVLYFAKVVFLPLAFAILFAFLLAPLVTALERLRLPRVLAVLAVILGFALVLGSIGWAVTMQLIDVTDELPTYRANIAEKLAAINRPGDTAFTRAEQEVERLRDQIGTANSPDIADARTSRSRALGSPARPIHVQDVSRSPGRLDQLGGILQYLVTAFLTVVFTFFVLLQREDLRNRMIRLTGQGHLNLMTQAMNDASQRISRYFSLQLLVNSCFGLIIFGALHFVGLPHALLFGTLATLFRFVPYVGAPAAALVPTVFSLAMFHGWTKALMIMGIFFCLEVVTGNYIEPRLYGKHTGLSSLAIIIAATFWTLIWGPVGLMLSVPLTVCLVVIGRHVPSLEFLMVLLGDQPVIAPSACYYQRLLARDEREAGEVLDTCLKESTLADVYDSVIIPALTMSEHDRHQKDLDEATVGFIHQTTRDLIEELDLKENLYPQTEEAEQPTEAPAGTAAPLRVLCMAVRDEADAIVATMLAQLLDSTALRGLPVPAANLDAALTAVSTEKPDLVFLSGVPPFARARSRRVYRSIRARAPRLKIMIGLWNYSEDEAKAAQEISRGEEDHIATTLSQAIAQVRFWAEQTQAPPATPAILASQDAGEEAFPATNEMAPVATAAITAAT